MTASRTLPTTTSPDRSGLVTGSRWTLVVLTVLFTAGALGQFFLVGMSMFEDGTRWSDHKTLGHIIGMLPWVMWIPAVLGKTGRKMIISAVLLFVLFEMQYVFINAPSGIAKAFHPLNGSLLLVFGAWISYRAIVVARSSDEQEVSA